jgi:hypothetical protein
MFKQPYLEYKKTNISERGVILVEVFSNQKTFFVIECLNNSPYTIEEEIQNWLDDNGYDNIKYEFIKIN